MTDVLVQLEPFTWRGIRVPVTGRSASFRHEAVDHPLSFVNGELVEQTGRKNWTFSYTVPMREDIAKGPYEALFSQQLGEFVNAMLDREPGILSDPVYGEFRCVPVSFEDALDVARRDGVDLTVEFVHSPTLGEIVDTFDAGAIGISDAAEEAGRIDDAVELVDWEQEEPPEPSANPLDAINGAARQIEQEGKKIPGALNDTARRLENLEQTVERLTNPNAQPVRRSARRLRDAVLALVNKDSDPQRRIRSTPWPHNSTVPEVAAELGMTVQELLRLNPDLAQSPRVDAGTEIFYFVTAATAA